MAAMERVKRMVRKEAEKKKEAQVLQDSDKAMRRQKEAENKEALDKEKAIKMLQNHLIKRKQ